VVYPRLSHFKLEYSWEAAGVTALPDWFCLTDMLKPTETK